MATYLVIPYQEWPMNTGKTIFSQIMDFLPLHTFRKCVNHYHGNYKVKRFSCYDQFLSMAFAQLTYRESLRDIEVCLRSMQKKLYHMGFRCKISKSTLADANENRDWHIYAEFGYSLIQIAERLYQNEDFGLQLKESVYALDATTIELCLSVFPWARIGKNRSAIKMHTLLNLRGNIPSFIQITNATVCDHDILDDLILESGSFYLIDRGYIDLDRLYSMHLNSTFFIVRQKKKINTKRLYSAPVDKTTGLRCDQTIKFTGRYSGIDYPEKLRRIRYFDIDSNTTFVFLTNNMTLPAITIAKLHKYRWQIELFFRWIKQHLRIKAFFGISPNAVKTQIWIAVSIYILVAIIKKQLNVPLSLYTMLQILSITLFEKVPLTQVLTETYYKNENTENHNQLILFN
jgi:hypothetical protein